MFSDSIFFRCLFTPPVKADSIPASARLAAGKIYPDKKERRMKTTDLYSQLCEEHVLREAWEIVRRKNTRGGLDGISPEDLDGRIEKIIKNLSHDLSTGIYSPAPYQQFRIPKNAAANEWRTLSMPIVADKIVQQAFLHAAGPVIEKQFLDCSYAYRAGKGPIKAIRRLIHIIGGKKEGVLIRFDIDNFFDSLNRPRLLNETSRMLNDGRLTTLIRLWCDAGYISGKGKFSDPDEGIAQGAIISPLLSNIYLHALDSHAIEKGYGYLRYSDNFAIYCPDMPGALQCHAEIKAFLENELHLRLNKDPRTFNHIQEGFAFLGIFIKGGEQRISPEKEVKTRDTLSRLLLPNNAESPEAYVKRLNEMVMAKKRFYSFIKPETQYAEIDEFMVSRIQNLSADLRKRGALKNKGDVKRFVMEFLFFSDQYGKKKKEIAERIAGEVVSCKPISKGKSRIDPLPENTKGKGGQARKTQANRNRYLKHASESAEVLVTTPGVFIGMTGQRLVFRKERKNIHEHPFSRIRQITVTTTGVSFSSDLVQSCAARNIPLAFMDRIGKPYAVLRNPSFPNADLSLQQLNIYGGPKAITLIRKILTGKCRNQINIIKFYTRHRSGRDPAFHGNACSAIERMERDIQKIQQIENDGPFDEIRNRFFTGEARVSADYWEIVKKLLPDELEFTARQKRNANDVVNSMLNYGYGILYQRVWDAVVMAGLNPNISCKRLGKGYQAIWMS